MMATGLWRNLVADRRGTAIVEGALVAGFLIVAIIQMIVITQYYGASIRADEAADGIANMISQERTITPSSLTEIQDAAAHFLEPYDPPNALEVAHVVYRPDGTPSTATADGAWSLASGGPLFAAGELLTMAAGLGLPGEALIVVRIQHRDSQRFTSSMSILPDTIETTAFAKTRTGRPVLVQ